MLFLRGKHVVDVPTRRDTGKALDLVHGLGKIKHPNLSKIHAIGQLVHINALVQIAHIWKTRK
jgi:hypothetical protein